MYDGLVSGQRSQLGDHWATGVSRSDSSSSSRDCFITLAIEYGLCHYVKTALQCNCELATRDYGRPLLERALDFHRGNNSYGRSNPTPEMIHILFEYGADPNYKLGGVTAWQFALAQFGTEVSQTRDTALKQQWTEIFGHFIQNGARPKEASLPYCGPTTSTVEDFVKRDIRPVLPQEATDLENLLLAALSSPMGNSKLLPVRKTFNWFRRRKSSKP